MLFLPDSKKIKKVIDRSFLKDAFKDTISPHFAFTLLAVTTVLWGASTVITKSALDILTPFQFLSARFIIAAICATPLFYFTLKNRWKPSLLQLKKIIRIELLGTTLNLGLLVIGLSLTSAMETAIIMAAQPIMVAITANIILQERESLIEWVGLLTALLGTVIIVLGPTLEVSQSAPDTSFIEVLTTGNLIGNICIFLSVLAFAIYLPIAKKTYHQIPKTAVTGISFFVGAATFSFLALVEWFILPDFGFTRMHAQTTTELIQNLTYPQVFIAILYAGFFVSVIGNTAYIKAQAGIKAARAALIYYLAPIVSLPLAFLFLTESITLTQLSGVGVVLLGVVITELHWERLDSLHFSSPKTILNFVKTRFHQRTILNRRYKRQAVPPSLP